MGRDNQPKARQLRRKIVKAAERASYSRILIVTEGSKTEPLYLEEIRATYQLHSANVEVQPGQRGTAPIQVVCYAQDLFKNGNLHKGIRAKSFDQVYAVFDRDNHNSYFQALDLVKSLDGKMRNDEGQPTSFKAIASIPSFELWLLLHYEDIRAPLHRDEVLRRLRQHFPNYIKGAGNAFATTRNQLDVAAQRAEALAARFTADNAPEPFTAVVELVRLLTTLRG